MRSLDHVRWIGGASGAGKTTVARLLAERFEARVYSTDEAIGVHSTQLDPTAAPLIKRFRELSMDERWVERDPADMYRSFPWFHGEGFDLLLDDLNRLPADRPIIAEGFRLLPRLVRPHLSDAEHGVWLLPTPGFRRAAFAHRRGADAFWMRTAEPARALSNLLERDRLFTEELTRQTQENGVHAIPVDGTRTIGHMLDDLAQRFDLSARPR